MKSAKECCSLRSCQQSLQYQRSSWCYSTVLQIVRRCLVNPARFQSFVVRDYMWDKSLTAEEYIDWFPVKHRKTTEPEFLINVQSYIIIMQKLLNQNEHNMSTSQVSGIYYVNVTSFALRPSYIIKPLYDASHATHSENQFVNTTQSPLSINYPDHFQQQQRWGPIYS